MSTYTEKIEEIIILYFLSRTFVHNLSIFFGFLIYTEDYGIFFYRFEKKIKIDKDKQDLTANKIIVIKLKSNF